MKITKKQRKFVCDVITKWRPRLFLNQWTFDIEYFEEDDSSLGLKIDMKTEYKNAVISINVEDLFEHVDNDNKREELIVHELCHCIIQPLVWVACESADGRQVSQREIDWFKESVTQHVTRSIYYLNKNE